MKNPYTELGTDALWWTAQGRASELLPIAQRPGWPSRGCIAPTRRSKKEQIAYAADTGNLLLALALKLRVGHENRSGQTKSV
ncbi:hypothetical protein [Stenotrophomonas sp. NPDC077461]|uniref:hypothetical protein n=1 Tax=Stenotrophomonas sp. NPDC077461 TaxID=3414698 RepID=UPI003C2D1E86